MARFWIVHRNPRQRDALVRLAGLGEEVALGGPGDLHFDSLEPPDLVLLGLGDELEAELEFAHRFGERMPGSAWLLLADPADVSEAQRLFDALPAEVLAYPARAETIRERVRAALVHRSADPLSERRLRDALAARFSRYFKDLELPELLRALDPQLASVPVLVCGETGTGKGLLARYIHYFGGTTGGAFGSIACVGIRSADAMLEAIARAASSERARTALTLCFEDLDELHAGLQRELASWIDLAPPPAVRSAARLRFVATVGESALRNSGVVDPQLLEALSGVCLRLPPLRERADSISALVSDVAVAWCGSRGERTRHFSEEALDVLRAYPWPGNQRELEAVVARTLAAVSSDPVQPGQLRFEALPTPAGPVSHRPEEEEIARAVAGPGGEVPEEAEIAPAVLAPPAEEITGTLRRLVGAVAHEVRNPLVAIRTFAELLPDRFEDEEFRSRFAAAVEADVERIESVVDRLSHLATMPAPVPRTLDVAALIEELLDARRDAIRERHVLVLKELDRSQPFAVGDPEQLRFALESLLDKAFTIVPERGDVYVASKYHDSGLRGDPSCRVLVRFHGDAPGGPGARVHGVSLAETSLDLVVAEAVVRSQGGSFRLDTIDSEETVVVLDLPAPR